jgi:predicted CDP-diglyceride synthetase/phosphatidate cytidylyltransferase
MAKMTQEEIESFDELYQYIKKDIFEYTNQALPKYMILRLKGLSEGKFMANNYVKPMAKYEYKHILYAFKINKVKIKEIVNSSRFKNEQHKFNTIMLIIEKDINDVVNRLKQKVKSEEKIEKIDLKNVTNEGAEYKNKSNKNDKKLNNELEELW